MTLNLNTISKAKGGKVSDEKGGISNDFGCYYIINSSFL